MTEEETQDLQKRFNLVGPRIKDLETTIAQAYDQLRGIKEILAGGNPVAACREYFALGWRRKYGADYTWSHAKDSAQLKRLIRLLGVPDLQARMAAYLSTDDQFVTRQKHPFAVFVSTINVYTATTERERRPIGCDHEPACANDVAHTQRRQREMQRP